MSVQYPDSIEVESIGKSHDNRDILMLSVGKGETAIFCTAGIHGRESINPVLMLKMAEEYAVACRDNLLLAGRYPVRELLSSCRILMIPLVNPDGYEIAQKGYSAIHHPRLRLEQRIRRLNPRSWKYNARGVDINRNFPCRHPAAGQNAGSENETRALMEVFHKYDSIGYLDFHSRGKVLYYYRNAMPQSYNRRSGCLASCLQRLSSYELGEAKDEYPTEQSGGNSVHYFSELTGQPAITVETVEDGAEFPLDERLQEETFPEIHLLPLEMIAKGRAELMICS